MAGERIELPIVQLSALVADAAESVTANVQLTMAGHPLRLQMTVPTGPTSWHALRPLFQGLTNTVVDIAEQDVDKAGQRISCRAGCGACCRQLVPVSESEAFALKHYVDALPAPRRDAIRNRFADGLRRLASAGVLERIQRRQEEESARTIGLDYFAVGVPCPFLEDESCSIHPDRPLACREYLVTSPAENCSRPTAETVKCVPMPAEVSRAVREFDRGQSEMGWVPLIDALAWAESHEEPPANLNGPAVLQQVFAKLMGATLSAKSQ